MKESSEHWNNWLNSQKPKKLGFLGWIAEHKTGILATLVLHLLVLNTFLISRFGNTISHHIEPMVLVNFEDEKKFDVKEEIEKEKQLRDKVIEQMIAEELRKELRNSPVNIASKKAEKTQNEISTDKYLQELKNDYDFEKHDFNTDPDLVNIQKKEEKKIEEKAQYKGPTTIYYDLKDRQHRYLHIPVYMCQTYGKVCIDIVVDNQGNVLQSTINLSKTEVSDECLLEAALSSSRRSRFDAPANAPLKQKGSVYYLFLAQ